MENFLFIGFKRFYTSLVIFKHFESEFLNTLCLNWKYVLICSCKFWYIHTKLIRLLIIKKGGGAYVRKICTTTIYLPPLRAKMIHKRWLSNRAGSQFLVIFYKTHHLYMQHASDLILKHVNEKNNIFTPCRSITSALYFQLQETGLHLGCAYCVWIENIVVYDNKRDIPCSHLGSIADKYQLSIHIKFHLSLLFSLYKY